MEKQGSETVAIDADARTLPFPQAPANTATGALGVGVLLKGTYRLERRLGEGGMGSVYLAEHVTIRKKVAIKILGMAYAQRPELKQRFLREARATAAINHDHVIEIHDFGETPDGSAFFVMEYLQGVDLAALLEREGRLPWHRARDIMLQICGALAAAHANGIVHRDMKPANCLRHDRAGRDFIKVLDFGVAKVQDLDEGVGQALTRAGSIFGTPEYMSPEQARGDPHDHRVDIYAAGVILFEMLAGCVPFVADTFMGLLHKHIYEVPPRPSELAPHAGISAGAEGVILKALQKDPAHRFQSMAEMAAALTAVDAGVVPTLAVDALEPPSRGPTTYRSTLFPAPRRRPVLATVGLVAVGGMAVWWIERGNTTHAEPSALTIHEPQLPVPLPALVVIPQSAPALPVPDRVYIYIDTHDVSAEVFDEQDTRLGTTDDPAGVTLPRGTDERVLSLRAAGYEVRRVRVIPDQDLRVTALLTRKADAARSRKSPPRATPSAPPAPPTSLEPKLESNPEPKASTSPDLIKPFHKK